MIRAEICCERPRDVRRLYCVAGRPIEGYVRCSGDPTFILRDAPSFLGIHYKDGHFIGTAPDCEGTFNMTLVIANEHEEAVIETTVKVIKREEATVDK